MNRIAILFLQGVTVLIGVAALAFLIWEPLGEGHNAHASLFQIYFQDPLVAYAYIGSIPGFIALAQTFRLLGLAGRGQAASPESLKALGAIKLCALTVAGFVVAGELIFILFNTSDDRAGGVAMGVFFGLPTLTVAAAATVLEGIARGARRGDPAA